MIPLSWLTLYPNGSLIGNFTIEDLPEDLVLNISARDSQGAVVYYENGAGYRITALGTTTPGPAQNPSEEEDWWTPGRLAAVISASVVGGILLIGGVAYLIAEACTESSLKGIQEIEMGNTKGRGDGFTNSDYSTTQGLITGENIHGNINDDLIL